MIEIPQIFEIIKDSNTPPHIKNDYFERATAQLNRLGKLLDQLLSEAKEEMAYRWKPKKMQILVDSDEFLFIYTDGSALYRIVTNLLSNAIKYSYYS